VSVARAQDLVRRLEAQRSFGPSEEHRQIAKRYAEPHAERQIHEIAQAFHFAELGARYQALATDLLATLEAIEGQTGCKVAIGGQFAGRIASGRGEAPVWGPDHPSFDEMGQ
jgi:hypothetical protein